MQHYPRVPDEDAWRAPAPYLSTIGSERSAAAAEAAYDDLAAAVERWIEWADHVMLGCNGATPGLRASLLGDVERAYDNVFAVRTAERES